MRAYAWGTGKHALVGHHSLASHLNPNDLEFVNVIIFIHLGIAPYPHEKFKHLLVYTDIHQIEISYTVYLIDLNFTRTC